MPNIDRFAEFTRIPSIDFTGYDHNWDTFMVRSFHPGGTPMSSDKTSKKRLALWIGIPAVIVVALVAVVAWWFLKDDAPDEVNLADATAQITDTTPAADTASTAMPGTADPAESSGDVSGTWNVDTTIGAFSYADSTGTFVGFRVDEELAGIGAVTAVGRTPAVSGSLTIEGTTLTKVEITADMTAITTDDRRRDNKVLSALDTDQYPTATFVLTEPIELGAAATSGTPFSGTAVGELTIRGVTKPISLPLEAQFVNNSIVVVGSVEIVFADYGVEVPSAPIVVSAEDRGPLEMQLFFTR
jgi:polyisoprenoid-binding protein YceI